MSMSAKGKEGLQWWPKRTVTHRMKKVVYSNILLKSWSLYDILQERVLKTNKWRNINKQKVCLNQIDASSKRIKQDDQNIEFLLPEDKYFEKNIFSSQRNSRNLWFKKKIYSDCQDNHTALTPMNITCSPWWERGMAQNFWKPLGKTGIPGVRRLLAAPQGDAKVSENCNENQVLMTFRHWTKSRKTMVLM